DAPRAVAAGYTVERAKAKATIEGRRVALDGAANAYGAGVTFKGSVRLGKEQQAIAYDLRGGLRRVNLARLPRQLKLPLAETELNMTAHASGRGSSPASMEASICGELTDSRLFGGHVPQLTFDATLGNDAVRVKATGSVKDLDPSIASGRAQIKGDIEGSLDV